MKELSTKITPYLKHSVTEFQNEARVHVLEAEELSAQLSADRGVGAKADTEAKGSGDVREVGGGVISGGQGKDVDREVGAIVRGSRCTREYPNLSF